MSAVIHGGDLADLVAAFPGAPRPLIDLSTGINPWPYSVHPSDDAWCRLPQREAEQECIDALASYLGADAESIILTPGTQLAISLLPYLLAAHRVAIASPTYAEHAAAWRIAGVEVIEVALHALPDTEADILVVTNPNNPNGTLHPASALLDLAQAQAARGGCLIVDEAFCDVVPQVSLAAHGGAKGLVILRSFGKFFGLAGSRLGAVLAPPELRQKLRHAMGPWAVSGPALEVGAAAYRDSEWISTTRLALDAEASRLDELFTGHKLSIVGGTSLYRLAETDDAAQLKLHLAQAGIHVRSFDYNPTWLRFGLPPGEIAFHRLAAALESFR